MKKVIFRLRHRRDWHARGALHDHFFGDETTLQFFQSASYEERGDFCSEAWQLHEEISDDNTIIAILQRDGNVWCGDKLRSLSIEKRVILRAETGEELQRGESPLRIEYVFSNPRRGRPQRLVGLRMEPCNERPRIARTPLSRRRA